MCCLFQNHINNQVIWHQLARLHVGFGLTSHSGFFWGNPYALSCRSSDLKAKRCSHAHLQIFSIQLLKKKTPTDAAWPVSFFTKILTSLRSISPEEMWWNWKSWSWHFLTATKWSQLTHLVTSALTSNCSTDVLCLDHFLADGSLPALDIIPKTHIFLIALR